VRERAGHAGCSVVFPGCARIAAGIGTGLPESGRESQLQARALRINEWYAKPVEVRAARPNIRSATPVNVVRPLGHEVQADQRSLMRLTSACAQLMQCAVETGVFLDQ